MGRGGWGGRGCLSGPGGLEGLAGPATRVPEPWRAVSQPSATSWPYASATVLRARPRSAASARDDGIRVRLESARREAYAGGPTPPHLQVQVQPRNGPTFSHINGPYSWASWLLAWSYDGKRHPHPDTGPAGLRHLRGGLRPGHGPPGPGRDQGAGPGRLRPQAARAGPDPGLPAQRLRLLERRAPPGRAGHRRDRAAHLRAARLGRDPLLQRPGTGRAVLHRVGHAGGG